MFLKSLPTELAHVNGPMVSLSPFGFVMCIVKPSQCPPVVPVPVGEYLSTHTIMVVY